MAESGVPEDRIAKTMSLSFPEYQKCLSVLLGVPEPSIGSRVVAPAGSGTVEIAYAPLPGITLGGLLALPRATVTLRFIGNEAADRAAFVRAFDLAFRRGGG